MFEIHTLTQTHDHVSIPPLSIFTGWMPFLPPNQQRQSIEGIIVRNSIVSNCLQCFDAVAWVEGRASGL